MGRHVAREAGTTCKSCPAELQEDDGTRCKACAAARREADRAQREHRREHGLCLTCGKRAAKDKRYCKAHLAYYAQRQRGV